jgi:hypothetical protein
VKAETTAPAEYESEDDSKTGNKKKIIYPWIA